MDFSRLREVTLVRIASLVLPYRQMTDLDMYVCVLYRLYLALIASLWLMLTSLAILSR